MGRQRRKPQQPPQPPADSSPFEESEDDEVVGSPIPDDDGWVYLRAPQEAEREQEKPKRRAPRRGS